MTRRVETCTVKQRATQPRVPLCVLIPSTDAARCATTRSCVFRNAAGPYLPFRGRIRSEFDQVGPNRQPDCCVAVSSSEQ